MPFHPLRISRRKKLDVFQLNIKTSFKRLKWELKLFYCYVRCQASADISRPTLLGIFPLQEKNRNPSRA